MSAVRAQSETAVSRGKEPSDCGLFLPSVAKYKHLRHFFKWLLACTWEMTGVHFERDHGGQRGWRTDITGGWRCTAPNIVNLCMDSYGGKEQQGRLYHLYTAEAVPFSSLLEAMDRMDRLYDMLELPQASYQTSELSGKTGEEAEKGQSRGQRDHCAAGARKEGY